MGKHSTDVLLTYVTMKCNTQSCIKKHINVSIIMHKLSKDVAVKSAWLNTKIKGRQQLIHTFATTSLLGWLINSSPVFNKINPSPVR